MNPPKRSSIYRPLYLLTYKIESALFGLSPFTTRLFNLALHLSMTALLYLFLKPYTAHAWLGTLLFALHPVLVEPVSWSSGRHELLFALGTILLLRSLDSKNLPWAFLIVLGGCLSKETFLPVSLMLVLIHSYQHGRQTLLLLFAILAVGLLRAEVLGANSVGWPTLDIFLRNLIFSLSRYFEVLSMPWRTGVFKANIQEPLQSIQIFQAIACLLMAAVLGYFSPSGVRVKLLLIFFVPVLTLSLVADLAGHVHDRYFYVPHFAWAAMFSCALPADLYEIYSKNRVVAFLSLVFMAISFLSYRDSKTWQSYSAVIEKNILESGHSPQVYLEAAQYALRGKNNRQAKVYLHTLLKLSPEHVWARNAIAVLSIETADFEEALQHLKSAYALNPQHAQTSHNLGFYFESKGDVKNAQKWYHQALVLKGTHRTAH